MHEQVFAPRLGEAPGTDGPDGALAAGRRGRPALAMPVLRVLDGPGGPSSRPRDPVALRPARRSPGRFDGPASGRLALADDPPCSEPAPSELAAGTIGSDDRTRTPGAAQPFVARSAPSSVGRPPRRGRGPAVAGVRRVRRRRLALGPWSSPILIALALPIGRARWPRRAARGSPRSRRAGHDLRGPAGRHPVVHRHPARPGGRPPARWSWTAGRPQVGLGHRGARRAPDAFPDRLRPNRRERGSNVGAVRCPWCSADDDRVVDSRLADEGVAIRRRRECLGCGRRFTTFERVEEQPLWVVKRSGQREPFDRAKLIAGVRAACKNRPVTDEAAPGAGPAGGGGAPGGDQRARPASRWGWRCWSS